ncbi:uncharacterized protein METZ01_LOCUS475027, partial [marine metagenome]
VVLLEHFVVTQKQRCNCEKVSLNARHPSGCSAAWLARVVRDDEV